MIDLHLHTTYSDGEKSVLELIDILNEKNILVAAIADHNSVGAHIEYEENGYDKIYRGVMHKAVELQVIVDNQVIEFLAYDFDLDKFKVYVQETKDMFWRFHKKAYEQLLAVADSMGLKYIEPEKELCDGYYANMKFQEAINACYLENEKIIDGKLMTDLVYFYRHEFLNPESKFYIDNRDAFPSGEEMIRKTHECGGKVFLAHIDEYRAIEDKDAFLNYVINNYDIDGIECFHPTISEAHTKKYMKLAKEHNLLVSAGSDFHGKRVVGRENIGTKARREDITWI